MSDTEQQDVKPAVNKNKRYRKDKPWDTDDIDHWHIEPVTKEKPLPPPLEESSFATLFPKYREQYLREIWPLVTRTLKQYGIGCELDLIEGSMSVKTTRKTFDPYSILKARDLIKLLARSIPVQQAIKILSDDTHCDIIKIKNLVRNKERFVKRRQRLIGPNGCTLKAIELVTNCYVMVQGNTVSVMGSIKGLKTAREVVIQCMKNIHPIYNIKRLMIKKELANDPTLADENWDRFLPTFKKQNVKRKKKPIIKKKEYTPFPPEQTPRKVDLQLASGEYFLSKEEKMFNTLNARREENLAKKTSKKKARDAEFVPPSEEGRKRGRDDDEEEDFQSRIERMKKKFKSKKSSTSSGNDASDYVMGAGAEGGEEKEKKKKEKKSKKDKKKKDKKKKKKKSKKESSDDE